MDRYQHQTLTYAHSIRLLYISHDVSKPHSISLSLKEANLADEPEYSALSYTWHLPEYRPGKQHQDPGPGQEFEVECDGKGVAVSENLFRFLSTATRMMAKWEQRKRNDGDKTASASKVPRLVETLSKRPLWVDAFCINQLDHKERQHQVLLMDKIYSGAKDILVWLGDTIPSEDLLWVHNVFIPVIGRVMRRKSNAAGITQFVGDPLCASDKAAKLLGENVCSRWAGSWLSFANFIDRHRWFDRGWIVQEVALGSADNVALLCGELELSWRRFTALSHFLQLSGWANLLMPTYNLNLQSSFRGRANAYGIARRWWDDNVETTAGIVPTDKGPVGGRVYSIHRVHSIINQYTGQRSTWQLPQPSPSGQVNWYRCASHLISTLRNSQFEDDRDHIYGCLGMLSQILPPGFTNPIVPDYDKTTVEVFTSVAAMMLTNIPGLFELSQVEDRQYRRHHSLPSWVPDYSVAHRGYLSVGSDDNSGLCPDNSKATVGGSTNANQASSHGTPRIIIIGSSLILQGIRLKCIDTTGLRNPWDQDRSSFEDDLFQLILKATSLHTPNIALDFWDVLTRGNIDRYMQEKSQTPPSVLARERFVAFLSDNVLNKRLPVFEKSAYEKLQDLIQKLKARLKSLTDRAAIANTLVKLRFLESDLRQAYWPDYSSDFPSPEWVQNYEWLRITAKWERAIFKMLSVGVPEINISRIFETLSTQVHKINLESPILAEDQPLAPSIWNVLSSAALYVTAKDKLGEGRLGIGPTSCKPGDEIWMLEGSPHLSILRKTHSRSKCTVATKYRDAPSYQLVGETYIQGVDVDKRWEEMRDCVVPIVVV
ncbi:heterokaryon incompatibility protein-domain-containing protein [Rhypophila decipiens]|uniref:Heterokaryon incompatibility protein-domain-containing protein n=1 Tax=Rhypophila decipiens TaxID=261697 RepID=A0AAN7B4L4_9PEZI|nr:heterokaryon incompatibility protein-domain-containing protein [Rhypophila decipiens]